MTAGDFTSDRGFSSAEDKPRNVGIINSLQISKMAPVFILMTLH
jgi:hypothetical protein